MVLVASLVIAVSASASSVTVPDDFSTVQAALNTSADTVLVRAASYAETPTVSRSVALVGIKGGPGFDRPALAGLQFLPAYTGGFTSFAVDGVEFSLPVFIENNDELSFLSFGDCRILAGIMDISGFPHTVDIALRTCLLRGDVLLKADGTCVVDSSVVETELVVGQENCRLLVTNSKFHGSRSGDGITTIGQGTDIFSASVVNTVVYGYDGGIAINAISAVQLDGNIVRDCLSRGINVTADVVRITNSAVERCGGYGIVASGHDSLTLVENTVANCGESGVLAVVDNGGRIEGNVVWGNNGEGLHVGANPVAAVLRVRNNTLCFNGGAGLLSECYVDVDGQYEVAGNISFANHGYGVRWGVPEVSLVRCNDWFGNSLGDVHGRAPSSDDVAIEPAFCDPGTGDFHLVATSPLVSMPGCGLVGALGAGCSVTATVVTRFVARRVADGVEIVWAVAWVESDIWVERSEAGEQGPWVRPTTSHSRDYRGEVELDGTVALDRSYWYRLVAGDGLSTVIIGLPIVVRSEGTPTFRLIQVGPSPARGPVRIRFSLERQAAIELDVFDVLGRLVATLAHGVWAQGGHEVEWHGATGDPQSRRGVYLVRYRYPGGEDRRRLVWMP